MPYTLLRGIFQPDAGFPDGDTIRFAPENSDLLFSLPRQGRSPRVNVNNGTVSLRGCVANNASSYKTPLSSIQDYAANPKI